MSYVRFGEGDVYVYATSKDSRDESKGVCWECCACPFEADGEPGFPRLDTRSEMIAHLERHEARGHSTGQAIEQLKLELLAQGETAFGSGDG